MTEEDNDLVENDTTVNPLWFKETDEYEAMVRRRHAGDIRRLTSEPLVRQIAMELWESTDQTETTWELPDGSPRLGTPRDS